MVRSEGYGGGDNGALAAVLAALAANKTESGEHSDNTLATIMATQAMSGKRDDGQHMGFMLAVILIVFFVAIIFLALMLKHDKHQRHDGGGIAEILAATIAAKGIGNEGHYPNVDGFAHAEIIAKLEHNEDRAEMRKTQNDISRLGESFMQLGFGLSGQIHNNEKTQLESFAKVENQLGALTQGMSTLIMENNNEKIIAGVVNQILGAYTPCSRPAHC